MKKGRDSILKSGVTLIIPVLNEEKTLPEIIKRCSKQRIIKQLVIVNDGSTDRTGEVLDRITRKKQQNPILTIIHHKSNLGKGSAIKTGLKKALAKYVMVQDADLEYSPEDIIKLYKKAEETRDGIVFGSRTRGKNKGYLLAQLGNWYLNKMFNILFYYFPNRKLFKQLNFQ